MHTATVVVATATASTAVRSPALLFTAAFHISRFACDVQMILRVLFEVSSATADSAAPWCRHAHICCHRGNGDAFDCRALCDAALHDGLSVLLPAPTVAAIPAPTAVPLPTRRRPFKLLGSACLLATSALGCRRRCCSCRSRRRLLRHFKCQRPSCFLRRQSCRCLPRLPCHFRPDDGLSHFSDFARVSNFCVESQTPVSLPAPTFMPLRVPTAVLLLAPTVVPLSSPTAVSLPTAVPFSAHTDCRTTSGADGRADAGPDCRHLQYQWPSCFRVLRRYLQRPCRSRRRRPRRPRHQRRCRSRRRRPC